MGIEDEEITSGSVTAYTRYGLGARGIDYMEKVTSSGTVVAYPIYDAHGNMVATLQRSGTNSYTFGDQRNYDAWGKIRSGSTTGDPKGTYCASLGHKQDDESGFVYMRAQYYEPTSGRFASEDPGRNNGNWFFYCGDDPVNRVDRTGKVMWAVADLASAIFAWIAYLVFNAAEGAAVLGIGIGGSVAVGVACMLACAVLAICGAITTVQFFDNWSKNYDLAKPLLASGIGETLVTSLKLNGASIAGHQIEIMLGLADIFCDE